ncbi:hypothetical protein FRC03_011500 [Tulasnella sp. 419]|nr:hypothetical protein FRC03_011500 [Tulasnella sp. 419]
MYYPTTGYWSSGQRLQDSAEVQGQGINGALNEIMPEYVCGGAHAQKRSGYMKSRNRRVSRKPRGDVVPSNHTGAQTAKKRKPGARVTKALPGEGEKLSEEGGSKGKRANSNRAREERRAAAERRLRALQGLPSDSQANSDEGVAEDQDSDVGDGDPEDDDFRRTAMKEVMSQEEMDLLRTANSKRDNSRSDLPEPTGDRSTPKPTSSTTTSDSDIRQFFSSSLGKRAVDLVDDSTPEGGSMPSTKKSKQGLLESEIQERKRESLGLTGSRVLGSRSGPAVRPTPTSSSSSKDLEHWTCAVCTLINHPDYRLCAACSTRRGESI